MPKIKFSCPVPQWIYFSEINQVEVFSDLSELSFRLNLISIWSNGEGEKEVLVNVDFLRGKHRNFLIMIIEEFFTTLVLPIVKLW